MKILCHINSLGKGGAERVMATLIDKFIENGHEIVLATVWTADNEYTVSDKVHRIHVGLTDSDMDKSRVTKFTLRYKGLKAAIDKTKPNVIISFTRNANYRALLAATGSGIPVIVSERNNPFTSYPGRKNKLMVEAIYRLSGAIVCQTEMAKSYFSEKLKERTVIIENPINERYLSVIPADHRDKRIVTSGRLNRVKNHRMLLEAMAQVHDKYPEYTCEIYGTAEGDSTEGELREYIETNGMSDYAYLMGNSDKLDEDIRTASMFVMTSNHEGMPNSLIEAMAMGIPVITTDCPAGACRQIVERDDSGLIVNVGDADRLATQIVNVIENPEEADMRARRGMYVRETMNPDTIFAQWSSVIDSVCTVGE